MSTDNRSIRERLLARIAATSADVETLRRVRMEIAASGTASATLSSGGGSKSYTRLDIGNVNRLLMQLESELAQLRRRLTGASPIRRIMFTR